MEQGKGGEDRQRGEQQAARAVAHDQPGIGIGTQRHRAGDAGKNETNQRRALEHVEHDLLDRIDE
jgi:hypothetical protein